MRCLESMTPTKLLWRSNNMDYKASLKEWMAQHMLGSQDVRDILNEMREDDRAIKSETSDEPNDSMDGDFDSAMASAGHGTDEDYNGGCFQMEDFGWAGDENLCGE
jgi:hypothetical protein